MAHTYIKSCLSSILLTLFSIGAIVPAMAQDPDRLNRLKDNMLLVRNIVTDSMVNQIRNERIDPLEQQYQSDEKDLLISNSKLLLSRQQIRIKEKNLWLLGITAGALLLASMTTLLYFLYRSNQHKQHFQEEKLRNLEQKYEISQLKAVMKGEETERTRVARELHDGIGGKLAFLMLQLHNIREDQPLLQQNPALDAFAEVLAETAGEVRETAHNLMPEVLVKYPLKEALLLYFQNYDLKDRFQVDFQYHGDIHTLSKSAELFLYRIIQELLQNVVKHSEASRATVQLMLQEHTMSILVEDNGIGFNPEEQLHAGMGLANLIQRVASLQGYCAIHSRKGQDTLVHIEIGKDKLLQL